MCQKAGISPQTLAKVEGGQGCTPGVERKLADALGTVVGRLWETLDLRQESVRTPAGDRWYFAGHDDGERYWRSRSIGGKPEVPRTEPLRYDPDAIQDEGERARMGLGGLAVGFVRVTTGHLRAGTVISSVIELYRRFENGDPGGRLVYFYVVRGRVRFHLRGTLYELGEGDVIQAEISADAWFEPSLPVVLGAPAPLMVYVDLAPRLVSAGAGG